MTTDYKKVIDEMCYANQIKPKYTKTGASGMAYHKKDGNGFYVIKIPLPKDFMQFGVCLHEIGHVVKGHVGTDKKSGKLRYVEEYEAEMFAIEHLKLHGLLKFQYLIESRRYVTMKVAQAFNRGHDIRKVPKEIIKFCQIKINQWKKAKKVFVYTVKDQNGKREIIVNFRI